MAFYRFFIPISLFGYASLAFAESPAYPINEVAPGVFYHQGQHEDADHHNVGAIANVGFIVGDKCVAVIDTGGSYREGELLLQAIRQETEKPICYVINTHVHPDHSFGNAVFLVGDAQFVTHEKFAPAQQGRQDFYKRNFSEILGPAYDGVQFFEPQITVQTDSALDLDLGNRVITLTAYGTAHTDHDLTVLDHTSNTLWTGDLLFRERIPALDGNLNGWINALEQLATQSYNIIIPGHGPARVASDDPGWLPILRYLSKIRDEVRLLIANWATLEEATEIVAVDERPHWKLFDLYHRRNVTAAFVELEWE